MESLYSIFCNHPRITTDTRKVTPDSIFFALRGASFDGNEYATKALELGAAWAVVDRADIVEQNPDKASKMLLVDDSLKALQSLARQHRRALGIKILAITGSNGKTTTKELLARVLSKKYRTYATEGNLNNHIGVPLTLLSIPAQTQFAIVEMGASSCKEIELLCSIAEPNFGILTNVGRAHLDGFGGEEGVKRGKGELLDFLDENGGEAYIATENETIRSMAASRIGLHTIEYSYTLSEGVKHNLEGEYNRYNIAAAVAVGLHEGISQEDINSAIESYKPTNNRSQRSQSANNIIIWDCYNANPSSMQVAIENFAAEQFPSMAGKVAILGDMFELGEWAPQEHLRTAQQALNSDIERIILVGKNFSKIDLRDPRIEFYESREDLEKELAQRGITARALLIKGSRGVGLEALSALL